MLRDERPLNRLSHELDGDIGCPDFPVVRWELMGASFHQSRFYLCPICAPFVPGEMELPCGGVGMVDYIRLGWLNTSNMDADDSHQMHYSDRHGQQQQ